LQIRIGIRVFYQHYDNMMHMHNIIIITVKYQYNHGDLHMTKLDRLSREIQRSGVVSRSEMQELGEDVLERRPLEYRYLYTEYLAKLIERGDIERVRRGLYVATPGPGSDGSPDIADRYTIASKVRKEYYLGFHTALELHGCAYSWFNSVTVCLGPGAHFRPFEFQGTVYRPALTGQPRLGTEVIDRNGHQVTVSNPARTFVDCLDRPHLAGGWEEVLKSLESLPGVRGDELVSILRVLDKRILFRKAGRVLELLGPNMYYEGVLESVEDVLRGEVGGQPLYMDRRSPGPLNERWNVYDVPGLDRMLEGV
jgi:predicted transcriptional regulator of viral defense system